MVAILKLIFVINASGDYGTIDGQGSVWWDLISSHSLNYSRPHLIEFIGSDDITISNLTFLNSPAWDIHPVYCRYKWLMFVITDLFRKWKFSVLCIFFVQCLQQRSHSQHNSSCAS